MRAPLLPAAAAAGLATMVMAAPAEGDCKCDTKVPAFFLAGDSTTAIQLSNDETHGGGWGNGFLALLKPPAWGINYGHNGATTASFVSMGDWGQVMADVKNRTAKYSCFVTIQVSCLFHLSARSSYESPVFGVSGVTNSSVRSYYILLLPVDGHVVRPLETHRRPEVAWCLFCLVPVFRQRPSSGS